MMDDFRPGDRVAVRKDYLGADQEDISCLRLIRAGLPNEFTVVKHVKGPQGIPAVILSPCCERLRDPHTGQPYCAAHPAMLFELVARGEPDTEALEAALNALGKNSPAAFITVDSPLGMLHFGHYKDGDKEGIMLRVPGLKPITIAGRDYGSIVTWLKENVL